jgi:Fe-S-cluster-containing dehydrogenase component/anaerobic selenocysteine-containing dehydrogenase
MKNKIKHWQDLKELQPGNKIHQESKDEFDPKLFDNIKTDRRDFLKVMGFSVAGAMAACSRMPVEKSLPYLIQPKEIVPGKAYWYASTCHACSANCGILIKNRDGRPIKIEGNPDAKLNQGGLCASGQASVLELYDSGRLQHPLHDGKKTSWANLDKAVLKQLEKIKESSGALRVVTSSQSSPSLNKLIQEFLAPYANAKHVVYDSISQSGLIEAHEAAFGKAVLPHFHFSKARYIVSFGADFLGSWISPVEFTKGYSLNRKVTSKNPQMSKHIQVESRMSLTGANADERVLVKQGDQPQFILALLAKVASLLGQGGVSHSTIKDQAATIEKIAKGLVKHKRESLIVSDSNDKNVQLVVAKLNHMLGSYGKTLDVTYPSQQKQGKDADFTDFVKELNQGKVDTVILWDVNPAYNNADAAAFKKGLKKTKLSVALAERLDETAKLASFVVPLSHALESWGDSEPVKGSFHLTQPAIHSVYDTRMAGDVLLKWQGKTKNYEAYLKDFWQKNIYSLQSQFTTFTTFWRKSLQKGFYQAARGPFTNPGFTASLSAAVNAFKKPAKSSSDFELELYQKVSLRDGKHANNPWLQELPDPISKVVWDNYLNISVKDAEKLGLQTSDVVQITVNGKVNEIPVYKQPGQLSGTLSLALGYGREAAGKVANGIGVNAFSFVETVKGERKYVHSNVTIKKTVKRQALALTQTHMSSEGRPIFKETTLAAYKKNNASGNEDHVDLVMLWKQHKNDVNSWAMAIDTNTCTGCSGCLIGCQSENNVPVVGKQEVLNRREMHWLRIDRYFSDSPENPDTAFQPMMCQHCANAPCESVCPVLATVHSSDGLNQQVYNRCVGTRYCANNCPYKVRRFNWFDYADNKNFDYYMNNQTGKLVLNPDVVVRSRGVMEKCSMCVQRIQEKKLQARKAGKAVNADDIQTACQQSCPSDAIVFGDLNDPNSKLVKLIKGNKRNYQVLSQLNIKPHVNYLTKVRNKG